MRSNQTRGHYRWREKISLEDLPLAFLHACKIPDIRMAGLALLHEFSFGSGEPEADSNSAADAALPEQAPLSRAHQGAGTFNYDSSTSLCKHLDFLRQAPG